MDGDGVESDGDDEFYKLKGRPKGIFEQESKKQFSDGEDKKTRLLLPFHGNGNPIILQLNSLSSIELNNDSTFQLLDDLLRQSLVANIDNQRTTNVSC